MITEKVTSSVALCDVFEFLQNQPKELTLNEFGVSDGQYIALQMT